MSEGGTQISALALPEPGKLKVFVSYSRKDMAFAGRLVADLKNRDFEAYLDKNDILPGEAWKERLGALISSADNIVFLISPDSIASEQCGWEADEAVRLSKRIFPLVYRETDTEIPGRIKRLNYIFMRERDDYEAAIDVLAAALRTDIDWVRKHTWLTEQAGHWQRGLAGDHALLRGNDLAEAELWVSTRPPETLQPTETQRSFIKASREAEIARADKERRQIRRTKFFQRAVSVLLVIGAVGVIWQDIQTTKREQAVFLNPIGRAVTNQRFDRAMRYALLSYPSKGAWPWTPLSTALEGKLGGAAWMSSSGALLKGHTERVSEAAFSPDGTRVVTSSYDHTARIWDTTTGRVITQLNGHRQQVARAQFNPDGMQIATASWDGTAIIWDAKTGKKAHILDHEDLVLDVTYSPDGKLIATASADQTARIWDAATGKQTAILAGHRGWVSSVAFDADGSRVITASRDKTARVWNAETGQPILTLVHDGEVATGMFSPDGTRIVTASADKTARIWAASTGEQVTILDKHKDAVKDANFSPDGMEIVTSSADGAVRTWDAVSGQLVHVFAGHSGAVWRAVYSRDGKRIISASDDGTARLWEASTGTEVASFIGHEGPIYGVSFDPKCSRLVTASEDGTARIWNAESAQKLAIVDGRSARFSPDSDRLVTIVDGNNSVPSALLWGTATAKSLAIDSENNRDVATANFAASGLRIVSAPADNSVIVWNEGARRKLILRGHTKKITCVSMNDDGSRVVTSSEDRTVRLWDAETAKQIAILDGLNANKVCAVFNSDGTRFLSIVDEMSSEDGRALLWDSADGRLITELNRQIGHKRQLRRAAFSANGRVIATGSADYQKEFHAGSSSGGPNLLVWDAATLSKLHELKGHRESISELVFSPSGDRLFTSALDHSGRLWDPVEGREIWSIETSDSSLFFEKAEFSRDGSRIVTKLSDGSIRIWDALTGAEIAALKGARNNAASATFSADERLISSASVNGTTTLWDATWLDPNNASELRDRVCAEKLIGAQEFTNEELTDPILSGIDKDDPVDRNPCLRRGPLSLEYYTQTAERWYLKAKGFFAAKRSGSVDAS